MKKFDHLTYLRETSVCGIAPWLWPIADVGAWEGPHKEFEGLRDKLLAKTKHRGTIVQAGGCCGLYPRLWLESFQRVYTFEPDPLSFHCLVNNCQSPDIHKYNAALGHTRGTIWLNGMDNLQNVGMHQVATNRTGDLSLQVQVMLIDDLELDACDAIQLDIEGYEYPALKGAEKTIEKFRPVIATENPSSTVTNFLAQFGYVQYETNVADKLFFVG